MAGMLVGARLAISPCFSSQLSASLSRASAASSAFPSANSRLVKPVRATESTSAPSSPDSSSSPPSTEPSSAAAAIDSARIPPAAPWTSASLVSQSAFIMTKKGIEEIGKVNYYKILQIRYGAPTTEVVKAFKDRVMELKSRQNEGDDDASRQQEHLRTLQAAFDTLTSNEERRIYDWVLERYENLSFDEYIWPYEADITQDYVESVTPPVMRSFDEEGNRRVGLFLLAWVLLSFVLSATMKTWIPTRFHG